MTRGVDMQNETNTPAQNEPDPRSNLRRLWLLAVNPQTESEVLEGLINAEAHVELVVRIAEHPRASAETLCRLAQHAHAEVRAAVAENSNSPAHLLQNLSRDESPDVRYRLAENANIPLFILQDLTDDSNPYVAYRAVTTINRLASSGSHPCSLPGRKSSVSKRFA